MARSSFLKLFKESWWAFVFLFGAIFGLFWFAGQVHIAEEGFGVQLSGASDFSSLVLSDEPTVRRGVAGHSNTFQCYDRGILNLQISESCILGSQGTFRGGRGNSHRPCCWNQDAEVAKCSQKAPERRCILLSDDGRSTVELDCPQTGEIILNRDEARCYQIHSSRVINGVSYAVDPVTVEDSEGSVKDVVSCCVPRCVINEHCEDGNACTDNSCVNGQCVVKNEPKDTPCDDGHVCTGIDPDGDGRFEDLCDGVGVCQNPLVKEELSQCSACKGLEEDACGASEFCSLDGGVCVPDDEKCGPVGGQCFATDDDCPEGQVPNPQYDPSYVSDSPEAPIPADDIFMKPCMDNACDFLTCGGDGDACTLESCELDPEGTAFCSSEYIGGTGAACNWKSQGCSCLAVESCCDTAGGTYYEGFSILDSETGDVMSTCACLGEGGGGLEIEGGHEFPPGGGGDGNGGSGGDDDSGSDEGGSIQHPGPCEQGHEDDGHVHVVAHDCSDSDGDEVPAEQDNCRDVSNPGQEDTDGDGAGDACDDTDSCQEDGDCSHLDLLCDDGRVAEGDCVNALCFASSCDDLPVLGGDGDGVPDGDDNCLTVSNADQADIDEDGIGDACDPFDDSDSDGDGIPAEQDNCPAVANPGQEDVDGDGLGNVCDADNDNDGVPDDQDNCPLVANADQADIDEDGIGDACDSNVVVLGDVVDDSLIYCLEAEDAEHTAIVKNDLLAREGKYLEMAEGTFVKWGLTVPDDGAYQITFGYRLAAGRNGVERISFSGIPSVNVTFAPQQTWSEGAVYAFLEKTVLGMSRPLLVEAFDDIEFDYVCLFSLDGVNLSTLQIISPDRDQGVGSDGEGNITAVVPLPVGSGGGLVVSVNSDVTIRVPAASATKEQFSWWWVVLALMVFFMFFVVFLLWWRGDRRPVISAASLSQQVAPVSSRPTVVSAVSKPVGKIRVGAGALMGWLRAAVQRGYRLDDAVLILLHSGYDPVQVESVAQKLRQEGVR